MVAELAKQAIKIKCGFENAKMTGNYECAYALGIISKEAGISLKEDFVNLVELREYIENNIKDYTPNNDKIKRLIEMLSDYETTDVFDEQMKILYNDGYNN
jgi:hypothetical protein